MRTYLRVLGVIIVILVFVAAIVYASFRLRDSETPTIQETTPLTHLTTPTSTRSETEITLEETSPIISETRETTTTSETLKSEITYKVIEVIDGDSLVLEDGSGVRLLGINAPEEGNPFYKESKAHLSSLVLNKIVRLESDFEDKDRYDRLLRYIFIGDLCVNFQMVKDGWATVYTRARIDLTQVSSIKGKHGNGILLY